MRIIYFYQYFGTPKGGWSTRVYELTRRWVAEGHQVTVVTSLYDKSDLKAEGAASQQFIEGIDVRVVNVTLSNKHSFLYRVYTFLFFAIQSILYALRLNYDVCIASSGPISIGLPGLVAKYIRRKPLIFEVRDLWPDGAVELGLINNKAIIKLAYWFEKRCYLASNAIVALSEGMAASIRTRFGLKNVHVIPNASDNQLFSKADFPFDKPVWAKGKEIFVYTGTLGLMDNCEQIVDAAIVLHKRSYDNAVIVFVGDGKERQQLEKKANDHGLKNIHFLGLKPKEEVVPWLQNATAAFLVFKNVSVLNTCSPNKMFDAYAAGIPIIQTTQGWIKELLDKEKCGMNVQPNAPEEMANAIEEIAANKSLRNELAANAKRVALSHFDRDKLASEMLHIIDNVTNR